VCAGRGDPAHGIPVRDTHAQAHGAAGDERQKPERAAVKVMLRDMLGHVRIGLLNPRCPISIAIVPPSP
jgi:hypothetical protein